MERKSNGANGMSDMEGKVTRVGVSKPGGERLSILNLRNLTDQKFLIFTFYFFSRPTRFRNIFAKPNGLRSHSQSPTMKRLTILLLLLSSALALGQNKELTADES